MFHFKQLIWFMIIIKIHTLLAVTLNGYRNSAKLVAGKLISAPVVCIKTLLMIVLTVYFIAMNYMFLSMTHKLVSSQRFSDLFLSLSPCVSTHIHMGKRYLVMGIELFLNTYKTDPYQSKTFWLEGFGELPEVSAALIFK